MIYIVILIEQIVLYHLVGIGISKVLQRHFRLEERPGAVVTQVMGIATLSGVQFLAFLLNLPKNHIAMLILAVVTAGTLFAAARATPTREDVLPELVLPKRYSDLAFAVLLLPLILVWGSLGVTTGYNMVPKGDGWTWVVKATYWAFHAPLDIPGSPFFQTRFLLMVERAIRGEREAATCLPSSANSLENGASDDGPPVQRG